MMVAGIEHRAVSGMSRMPPTTPHHQEDGLAGQANIRSREPPLIYESACKIIRLLHGAIS